MARQNLSGIKEVRTGVWQIDKIFRICPDSKPIRIFRTLKESSRIDAEDYYHKRVEAAKVEAAAPKTIQWQTAVLRHVEDNKRLSNIPDQIKVFNDVNPFIGELTINEVNTQTVAPYVKLLRERNLAVKTIRIYLAYINRVLKQCNDTWLREDGTGPWLPYYTPIKLPLYDKTLPNHGKKKKVSFKQTSLSMFFNGLPEHLKNVCEFVLHTGLRECEACAIKWEWEVDVDDEALKGRVFIIPGHVKFGRTVKGVSTTGVKNGLDRIIVLNDRAVEIVNSLRSNGSGHVFLYKGEPFQRIDNSGWKTAWKKAGDYDNERLIKHQLPQDRFSSKGPHNLRHHFGHLLRTNGVDKESIRDLMGHAKADVTSLYTDPELLNLLNDVNMLVRSVYPYGSVPDFGRGVLAPSNVVPLLRAG